MTTSKYRYLIEWIGGVVATIIAGVAVYWLTNGGEKIIHDNDVLRKDKLIVPIAVGGNRQAADLDGGRLFPLGASIGASGADLIVRQSVHGIVLEPGISNDAGTFKAHFTRVSDTAAGRDGCAAAAISSQVSNHLQMESDIHVGSYVCMVTSEGRVAEFKILKVESSATLRAIEIQTVVWVRK